MLQIKRRLVDCELRFEFDIWIFITGREIPLRFDGRIRSSQRQRIDGEFAFLGTAFHAERQMLAITPAPNRISGLVRKYALM